MEEQQISWEGWKGRKTTGLASTNQDKRLTTPKVRTPAVRHLVPQVEMGLQQRISLALHFLQQASFPPTI